MILVSYLFSEGFDSSKAQAKAAIVIQENHFDLTEEKKELEKP